MKQMYLHRSSSGQPPLVKSKYDQKFRTTAAYRASMPDMMEVAHEAIKGANVPIQSEFITSSYPLSIALKPARFSR